MSDALLKDIHTEIKGLRADFAKANGGGGAVAPKNPTAGAAPKADANAVASDQTLTPAQKKAAADKAIAAAKAKKDGEAAKAAAAAAAAKPAAGGKGKRTVEQVREMIRAVAAKIDKQSALDILKDDGNGVTKVVDLKPDFYDAVYEACEVLIAGEGKAAAAPAEEEDDFA